MKVKLNGYKILRSFENSGNLIPNSQVSTRFKMKVVLIVLFVFQLFYIYVEGKPQTALRKGLSSLTFVRKPVQFTLPNKKATNGVSFFLFIIKKHSNCLNTNYFLKCFPYKDFQKLIAKFFHILRMYIQ